MNSITHDANKYLNRHSLEGKLQSIMSDEELGKAVRRYGKSWIWYVPAILFVGEKPERGYNSGQFAKIYTLAGANRISKKIRRDRQRALARAKSELDRYRAGMLHAYESKYAERLSQTLDEYRAGMVKHSEGVLDRCLKQADESLVIRIYPSEDRIFA